MSLRRALPWVLLVVVGVAALVVATRPSSPEASPEARVERLAAELRCPVCQGLSVGDSPSSTARAIVDDVRRRVEAGESDDAIKSAYVDRYGEWVLLRPRSSGVAALVWAVPVAVLVMAAAGLAVAFRRWNREGAMRATDADRDLVERARGAAVPSDGG